MGTSLASSAVRSVGTDHSGSTLSPLELARMLRAAGLNGAAMYNANDPEGCLRLFKQTAESVIAANGAQGVAAALQQASATAIKRTQQQRIWVLRCAFDTLL